MVVSVSGALKLGYLATGMSLQVVRDAVSLVAGGNGTFDYDW